jgi:predicted dithiol-disulfide oxidoreductase (DUF899 family)
MAFGDQGLPVVAETFDPPGCFSFAGTTPRVDEPVAGQLDAGGVHADPVGDERTHVRVVESGHELRDWPDAEKHRYADEHWEGEVGEAPRQRTRGALVRMTALADDQLWPGHTARRDCARRNKKKEEETVMTDASASPGGPAVGATSVPGLPRVVDRAAFEAGLDGLRAREKAHTREGDAIAAARRRLPAVEVDDSLALAGPDGPLTLLEAFEGRRQLIAYYFMWHPGAPAAGQCEGCTWCAGQVTELSYLHSRDITYAVFCQGPYDESARYRDFMGWDMPWYSARDSLTALLAPPKRAGMMHLVCYLRHDGKVFETYWTTLRGVETMDNSSALMDLTIYGRQESWEDSPPGWPQQCSYARTDAGPPGWPPVAAWPGGRPVAQWPRLQAGRSDDLGTGQDGCPDAAAARADGDARA